MKLDLFTHLKKIEVDISECEQLASLPFLNVRTTFGHIRQWCKHI